MGVAVVFPGQGSQSVGMADAWLTEPVAAAAIAEVGAAIGRDVVEGTRDEAMLATTAFAQPALLACEVAAYRTLASAGLRPIAAAGHSLGEFSALVAAESLTLTDAARLVAVRGEAMQVASDARPGGMTALLGVGPLDAGELCDVARGDDVLIVANENSPKQVVASGSLDALGRLEAICSERRIRAVRLNVAGAFHSPLMEPAIAALRAAIADAEVAVPRFPVASNVTGALVRDPDEIRELLARHVVSPVRWVSCVAALLEIGRAHV